MWLVLLLLGSFLQAFDASVRERSTDERDYPLLGTHCSFSKSSPNPFQFQLTNPFYTIIVCPNIKGQSRLPPIDNTVLAALKSKAEEGNIDYKDAEEELGREVGDRARKKPTSSSGKGKKSGDVTAENDGESSTPKGRKKRIGLGDGLINDEEASKGTDPIKKTNKKNSKKGVEEKNEQNSGSKGWNRMNNLEEGLGEVSGGKKDDEENGEENTGVKRGDRKKKVHGGAGERDQSTKKKRAKDSDINEKDDDPESGGNGDGKEGTNGETSSDSVDEDGGNGEGTGNEKRDSKKKTTSQKVKNNPIPGKKKNGEISTDSGEGDGEKNGGDVKNQKKVGEKRTNTHKGKKHSTPAKKKDGEISEDKDGENGTENDKGNGEKQSNSKKAKVNSTPAKKKNENVPENGDEESSKPIDPVQSPNKNHKKKTGGKKRSDSAGGNEETNGSEDALASDGSDGKKSAGDSKTVDGGVNGGAKKSKGKKGKGKHSVGGDEEESRNDEASIGEEKNPEDGVSKNEEGSNDSTTNKKKKPIGKKTKGGRKGVDGPVEDYVVSDENEKLGRSDVGGTNYKKRKGTKGETNDDSGNDMKKDGMNTEDEGNGDANSENHHQKKKNRGKPDQNADDGEEKDEESNDTEDPVKSNNKKMKKHPAGKQMDDSASGDEEKDGNDESEQTSKNKKKNDDDIAIVEGGEEVESATQEKSKPRNNIKKMKPGKKSNGVNSDENEEETGKKANNENNKVGAGGDSENESDKGKEKDGEVDQKTKKNTPDNKGDIVTPDLSNSSSSQDQPDNQSTSTTVSPSTVSPSTTKLRASRRSRRPTTNTTPEPFTYLPPPVDTNTVVETPVETQPKDEKCPDDLVLLNGVCLGFGALKGSGPRSMCQSHWQWSNTSCVPKVRAKSAPLGNAKKECANREHRNVNGHCIAMGPVVFQPLCASGWTNHENKCLDEQVLGPHTRECQMDLILVKNLCYGYEGPGDVWPSDNCPSGFVLRNRTCLSKGILPSDSVCLPNQMSLGGLCFGLDALMSSPKCISKWSFPTLVCLQPSFLPIQARPPKEH